MLTVLGIAVVLMAIGLGRYVNEQGDIQLDTTHPTCSSVHIRVWTTPGRVEKRWVEVCK